MLSEDEIRALLSPFRLTLSSAQIGQVSTYLELLMHWNTKINLTSIRKSEECVTRHFGESLYLANFIRLGHRLLDIGSGAGFPGLALRIILPEQETILLEPVGKKRAFLKEVARACEFASVDVRPERLAEYVRIHPQPAFNAITSRAVGGLEELVPLAGKLLAPTGKLVVWLSGAQGKQLRQFEDKWKWADPVALPLGRDRQIWIGERFT